ncbi:hypothetical protein C6A36_00030 [Desulfobacteraceae bacterium SEEP-SAG10]|nr:hypothetical protein C6A36_00030 [Desulfobacteraceae bacterium SEEP-SAG10]
MNNCKSFLYLRMFLFIIVILISDVSKAENLLLPERASFATGTVIELENSNTMLRKQDGSVILDHKQPKLNILLPLIQEDVTYTLICRSRSVKQDTFNLMKVTVNGKWIGNYYPCTETFTNKKLLFSSILNSAEIKMELIEGPGCLLDKVRLYPAERAYAIKELANKISKTDLRIEHNIPNKIFRKRAIESSKWLEGRGHHDVMGGLRRLVKRTANWGNDNETFKMMISRYVEYLETPELLGRHGAVGGGTSFEMHYLLNKWDQIEDDKKYDFSTEWRLEIINTLYYMARISFIDWAAYRLNRHYRKYRYVSQEEWRKLKIDNYAYQFRKENEVIPFIPRLKEFDKKHPLIPNNHMTHPALSLFCSGKYFERYNIPEVKVWFDVSRWTFSPLMNAFKPMEDSYMYQYWAMILAAKYALLDGQEKFFEREGPLWKYMDLEIVSTNNKSDGVSYGNVIRYGRIAQRFAKRSNLFSALTVNSSIPMSSSFNNLIKEKKPKDYVGIYIHQLENVFYEQFMDVKGGLSIPEGQRFDKISFREGWNKDDQYLLLDGISVGYHGHQDGNAIIEFSENNRTWLIDMGYWEGMRRAQCHNMVTINRPEVNNGEESPREKTPSFSALLNKADLATVAFISTSLRNYNGTDWIRNIIWKKGSYFAVLDKVINTKKGPSTATCRWRTLGDVNFKGNRFFVTQRPIKEVQVGDKRELTFVILHPDDSKATVRDGIDKPEHWKDYPYAKPIVRVLEETYQFDEKSSNQHVFMNLFYVTDKQREDIITARYIDDTSIKVLNDGLEEIIGIDGIETKKGLKTDAALFVIGKKRIALCNAKYLFLDGKKVFQSKGPMSIEIDFGTNRATVFSEKETQFEVLSGGAWIRLATFPGKKFIKVTK